jgi:hypothetical protein
MPSTNIFFIMAPSVGEHARSPSSSTRPIGATVRGARGTESAVRLADPTRREHNFHVGAAGLPAAPTRKAVPGAAHCNDSPLEHDGRRSRMKTSIHRAVWRAGLGLLLVASPAAWAQDELPPVQRAGEVEYMSGGIGLDESQAMAQAARQWPLALEFAVQSGSRGEYTADVAVLIRDAQGRTTLQTTADGPFLLVRLAPGRYTVEATLAGKTQRRSVTVAAKQPAKAIFVWKADKGADGS